MSPELRQMAVQYYCHHVSPSVSHDQYTALAYNIYANFSRQEHQIDVL